MEKTKIEIEEDEINKFVTVYLEKIESVACKIDFWNYQEVISKAIEKTLNFTGIDFVIIKRNKIQMFFNTEYYKDKFIYNFGKNFIIKDYETFIEIYFTEMDTEKLYFSLNFLRNVYKFLAKTDLFDSEFLKKEYPNIFKFLVMGRLME